MANEEHLNLLKQGVEIWNNLRIERRVESYPDFSRAHFRKLDLRGVDFTNAYMSQADLSGADLREAVLTNAFLMEANLQGADLRGADLSEAQLDNADFRGANLSNADLSYSRLVGTNFENTNLENCYIYGASVWDLKLKGARQSNLVISKDPFISVDHLEVAQFIYLLLNNEKIREVVDTITSKVVLILGRFTDERIAVLDGLREALRERNYLPILFDFGKPLSRDITETVSLLAHMARFVIADLTSAKSIPQELQRLVPDLPSVPVQPLLLASETEYRMFEHFKRYPWVLPTYFYENTEELFTSLGSKIITPAEERAKKLQNL